MLLGHVSQHTHLQPCTAQAGRAPQRHVAACCAEQPSGLQIRSIKALQPAHKRSDQALAACRCCQWVTALVALASLASVTNWRYVATHVVLFGVALFVTAISLVSGTGRSQIRQHPRKLAYNFLEVAVHAWRPSIASSCCHKSSSVPAETLRIVAFSLQAFMLYEVARAIRASAASYAPEGREQSLPGPILLSLNSAYDVVAFVASCGELKAKMYCVFVTCTWRENQQQSFALYRSPEVVCITANSLAQSPWSNIFGSALVNGAGAIGGAAARSSLTCRIADSSRECVMPNVAILAMAGAAAFLIITLSQDVHGELTWAQDTKPTFAYYASLICLLVHRHVQAAAGIQLGWASDHWESLKAA